MVKNKKEKSMYSENIAPRLRKARRECEMTQNEVAKKLKISQSTIAGYEKGRTEPNAEMLATLAQLYCHSVDYFLGLADD